MSKAFHSMNFATNYDSHFPLLIGEAAKSQITKSLADRKAANWKVHWHPNRINFSKGDKIPRERLKTRK